MVTEIEYAGKKYPVKRKQSSGKSISISVTPNQNIIIRAPKMATEEQVEDFIRRKTSWIQTQILFFKKHYKPNIVKEFITGESVWYLGRQYKLIVQRSSEDRVDYDKNRLYIFTTKSTTESIHNKRILDSWLREQRRKVFTERFEESKKRFDYDAFPRFNIKSMDKRWGSFIDDHNIVLNPKLIHVGTDCIDYVIVHELCHVKYKNHTKYFFEFLSKKYPEWEKVKEKLEMSTIV